MTTRTIWLHRAAPPKPAPDLPRNGCGVCCTSAPCPIGVLFNGRFAGRCKRLRFDEATSRYRCTLLVDAPAAHAGWAARTSRRVARAWVRRWIGAGIGCDSTAEAAAATARRSTEPKAD